MGKLIINAAIDNTVMALLDAKSPVIKRLESLKTDVDRYFYINNSFKSGIDVRIDDDFKHTFKVFYVMNTAGLTPEHFEVFFNLLHLKTVNLGHILRELYRIPLRTGNHSLQFSFATKLLHTVDNDFPIYDSLVSKFIDKYLNEKLKPDTAIPLDIRIQNRNTYYESQMRLFDELLEDLAIQNYINEIRTHFDWKPGQISDVKVLDFIIWSYGQLKGL